MAVLAVGLLLIIGAAVFTALDDDRDRSTSEESYAGQDLPDGLERPELQRKYWTEVTFCSVQGPIRVEMPGAVDLEGPRWPEGIASRTATSTSASTGGHPLPERYTVTVIDRVGDAGEDPSAVLERVVTDLDEHERTSFTVGSVRTDGGVARMDFEETYDWRTYDARAFGLRDVVVIVAGGVRETGSGDQEDASTNVEYMAKVIDLPDDDEVGAPCTPTKRLINP